MFNFAPSKDAVIRKPSLAILIGITTVEPFSVQVYLPALAGMTLVFSASASEIQLSMSAFFAAIALAQLVWGPLSDQFGRRPVVAAGMALFVVGTIICLSAQSIEALIVGRVLQGAGSSAGVALGRTIVRDLYSPRQAASMLGYVNMGMASIPMLAPLAGGFLTQFFGWKVNFWLMLMIGLTMLWVSIYKLPETHRIRRATGFRQAGRSYLAIARQPLYWSYALTTAFSATAFFAYLGGAPFVAKDLLRLEPSQMGFYFMFVAIGYVAGNFCSGRFAERAGTLPMILTGSVFALLAVGLIAAISLLGLLTPLGLFLPMLVLGFGNGITLPSAFAGAASVRPDLRGAASCLAGSMQVGAGACAGMLVAWLYSNGSLAATPWAMIVVMAAGVVLSLAAALTIKPMSVRFNLSAL